ncbi:MAG: DUF2892 domain-containing protein [Saprospiraceae bacterium]|nr:DUF2892 domain-containing protein [Saprospiraceae bacterium]
MKKNMGTIDRIIRVIIAVVIGFLFQQGIITGMLATILSIVAIVFLLTSVISFCPLYKVIGINTCPLVRE